MKKIKIPNFLLMKKKQKAPKSKGTLKLFDKKEKPSDTTSLYTDEIEAIWYLVIVDDDDEVQQEKKEVEMITYFFDKGKPFITEVLLLDSATIIEMEKKCNVHFPEGPVKMLELCTPNELVLKKMFDQVRANRKEK